MTTLIFTDAVLSGNHAHHQVIAAVVLIAILPAIIVKLVQVLYSLCLASDFYKVSSWKTMKSSSLASRYSTSAPAMRKTRMSAANTSPAKDKLQVRQMLFACLVDLSQLKEFLSICLLSSESNQESLNYQ